MNSELSAARHRLILIVYTAAIFVSALLLFSVQPLFTKMVLPRLGGSPAVWSVAMVFFQSLLLGGYGYAHYLIQIANRRVAVAVHLLLLVAALLSLPLSIASGWGEPPTSGYAFWLLGLFAVSIGLPFFALAGNNPLLQAWFVRTGHPDGPDPYFLYASSNIGSFLALLSYPVLLEPMFTLRTQNLIWTGLYGVLVVLIAACGALLLRGPASLVSAQRDDAIAAPPGWPLRLRWIFLAAVPSGLLIAVTAHISTDVAAAPLLWVLPLSLYLLTWVLVFQSRPLLPHQWMLRLQPLAIAGVVVLLAIGGEQNLLLTLGGNADRWKIFATVVLALVLIRAYPADQGRVETVRSFFGVHKIVVTPHGQYHVLMHGTTIHGAQKFQNDDGSPVTGRPEPITYYHKDGGIGQAIASIRERKGGALRVAVIGLGAGTLTCASEPGESWNFFEIDQSMVDTARDPKYFTYIQNCEPDLQPVIGDARLTFAKEPDGIYDLIIVDAYSSDAIPIHLATEEAMEIYKSKLAPQGAVVMHVSNRHLELSSVVVGIADANDMKSWVYSEDSGRDNEYIFSTSVVVSAREETDVGKLASSDQWALTEAEDNQRIWTDDYSNVLGAVWRRLHLRSRHLRNSPAVPALHRCYHRLHGDGGHHGGGHPPCVGRLSHVDHRSPGLRPDLRRRPADFRHGAADQGFGLSRHLRRVGPQPCGGDGCGARGVGAGFHAGQSPFAAVACRAIFLAGQIRHRSAAGRGRRAIRNRMGPCRVMPGAGVGERGDAFARGDRPCLRDGLRQACARRL